MRNFFENAFHFIALVGGGAIVSMGVVLLVAVALGASQLPMSLIVASLVVGAGAGLALFVRSR